MIWVLGSENQVNTSVKAHPDRPLAGGDQLSQRRGYPTHSTNLMLVHCLTATPPLAHTVDRYMLETVGIQLMLTSSFPIAALQVQAWTNLPTRWNSDDTWYAIDIPYVQTAAEGPHQFAVGLQPTSPGRFELTYRVGHRDRRYPLQWLGHPHTNVHVNIAPPAAQMDWTQGPNQVEILPGVYVGNFIAASQAEGLGIDAVLNLAEELDLSLPTTSPIAYLKLGCRDGARYPLPATYIRAAIAWLDEQLAQGKQKILIHCRAGIGRSGSIGVAYCYYRHPHWSYQRTLDYIWSKKPDIYPHQHLHSTLERLFPRRFN
jgi:dual specificity MAP kinase phosphatase